MSLFTVKAGREQRLAVGRDAAERLALELVTERVAREAVVHDPDTGKPLVRCRRYEGGRVEWRPRRRERR